jgi:putative transposase
MSKNNRPKNKYGVQKEHLRNLTKKEFTALRALCRLSKNMFNVGLYNVRQYFFEHKKYLNYQENYKVSKTNENYKLLGSACAQQTLKKVEEAFESFFELIKIEGQKASIPSYLDKEGFFELSYPQFKLQKDNTYNIPMSPSFKKEYGLVNIPFPTNLDWKSVCEIRILPKYNASYFEVEYVYTIQNEKHNLDDNECLTIDLGIDNFAAGITTIGTSFLLDGKYIKSINQQYNKKNSKLQSIKDKQGIKRLTKRQVSLLKRRNNQVRDYLNKAVRFVVDYCIEYQIGKVVVGQNKGWKLASNIGKANNQKFVQIPHSQFIKKLENMCERYGILFETVEESYTSKSSFLDRDLLPTYKENSDIKYTFLGSRIERGLYKTKTSILINADLNGAANILRKSNCNFDFEKVAKGLLTVPTRIRLVKDARRAA